MKKKKLNVPGMPVSFDALFDGVFKFVHECRDEDIPPDKCLAGILGAFFAVVGGAAVEQKHLQDICVSATNMALKVHEKVSPTSRK